MKTKKARSFRTKLWLFFTLFAAFILLVLWLLQTVFLQQFYDLMIVRNTRKIAKQVVESLNTGEDVDLDKIALENSLAIYICTEYGTPMYMADEHSSKKSLRVPVRREDGNIDFIPADEAGDDYQWPAGVTVNYYYPLDGKAEKIRDALMESKTGQAEIKAKGYYAYGSKFKAYPLDPNSKLEDNILVLANIKPIGSSVTVIRTLLIWVTILSLILAFILSWFLARRFSTPVKCLSEKAKKLGDPDYSAEYPKGFSGELDELSDTLDRTNEKLIAARNYQNELLANVSHDLRTPITMIKGYAEMINDISFEDREQCKEDMQVIVKESDRLTALVNEILAYSELQSEDKIDCSTIVDLSELTNSVVNNFSILGKAEGISVSSDLSENVFVAGSRSHLERMLFNLLENAARHVGDDKAVLVSLTNCGTTAKLSVADHGAGIPAEELAHIWNRYYTARQRDGKGVSGLGLAIVKQIATLHGGRCDVTSEPGKGSTFSVELTSVTPDVPA